MMEETRMGQDAERQKPRGLSKPLKQNSCGHGYEPIGCTPTAATDFTQVHAITQHREDRTQQHTEKEKKEKKEGRGRD
jgi:hypothetical protein